MMQLGWSFKKESTSVPRGRAGKKVDAGGRPL